MNSSASGALGASTPSAPADQALSNADLLPTPLAHRTWRWQDYAALWVGMV